ncbi:FliH/SctL family protein [Nocardioides euryhalodurans]|uniref:Flagellar assembly protein FliH/Type III secretion system HrpE domain-containing protein n=1 Tax=Nocardioides euryhalodurans TaxID=2518370 RepID=A0A4V1BDU8_9ACTN|nr:FliH/SctL family protein [Nocardioides euryhalodurans]QBR92372.1 hypothetical protein EXE57_08795 [Nocardioides euryhalodurans]
MSSSTEPAVGLTLKELRPAHWTRLGQGSVQGDQVTEQLLDRLAESTRTAARSQGYAVGWAEGRREAEAAGRTAVAAVEAEAAAEAQRREAEHRAALAALEAAAEQLRARFEETCRAVEAQAADLALELTGALVGEAAAEAGSHAVVRALAALPAESGVLVRLHPDVAATAAGDLRERGVTVLPDGALSHADAVVETDTEVVDLRVDTALARLRGVLS